MKTLPILFLALSSSLYAANDAITCYPTNCKETSVGVPSLQVCGSFKAFVFEMIKRPIGRDMNLVKVEVLENSGSSWKFKAMYDNELYAQNGTLALSTNDINRPFKAYITDNKGTVMFDNHQHIQFALIEVACK